MASEPITLSSAGHTGPRFATEDFTRSADGTRIHYSVLGDGPVTLVCCDGLGCDGYAWKYLVRDLASDYRIVRWHYRAHGRSEVPKDRSRLRISALCEDLHAVLDATGTEAAVLLGHSLGVQVLFEFQHQHPERVLGLVPICGSYGRPVDTFRDSTALKHAFPLLHSAVNRFPDVARRLWKLLDTELAFHIGMVTEVNGELMKREDFRPYLTHMGRMDPVDFVALLSDAAEHDGLHLLERIRVPTLIVAGERDAFTPYWLSTVMHSRIQGSELCTVPTGTHTALIEMPELVNLRIRRFLEERIRPASSAPAHEQRAG